MTAKGKRFETLIKENKCIKERIFGKTKGKIFIRGKQNTHKTSLGKCFNNKTKRKSKQKLLERHKIDYEVNKQKYQKRSVLSKKRKSEFLEAWYYFFSFIPS